MRILEWIIDAVLWVAVASDLRSADPVIAARRRASFGMFCSLAAAALLCLFALFIAPETTPASNGVATITAPFLQYVTLGFVVLACIASLAGLAFFVRYVLVAKWPERFVDLSE